MRCNHKMAPKCDLQEQQESCTSLKQQQAPFHCSSIVAYAVPSIAVAIRHHQLLQKASSCCSSTSLTCHTASIYQWDFMPADKCPEICNHPVWPTQREDEAETTRMCTMVCSNHQDSRPVLAVPTWYLASRLQGNKLQHVKRVHKQTWGIF